MPGALDALAAVAARVPVAVATSKPRAFAEPLCERLGLSPHLQRDHAAPSSTRRRRSRRSRSRRALAALGLEPGADAPLVGDRRHDAEAAHANGIRCVGVLWGIGDEAELRAAGADPIVASPADLPAADSCLRGSDPSYVAADRKGVRPLSNGATFAGNLQCELGSVRRRLAR